MAMENPPALSDLKPPLGLHCKYGYQICQDFSGSFDAHIHIPNFPSKATDWVILDLFYFKKTSHCFGQFDIIIKCMHQASLIAKLV